MPRVIEHSSAETATVEQVLDRLGDGFDPADEAGTDRAAALLGQLGNNRTFLGDLLVDQLKDNRSDAFEASAYGPQAIMLSPVRGRSFLRANIWPSANESCFGASGARNFVYGIPHDHNFDFLTVGYFGPGYVSDYFEYDYESVAGCKGEQARLRFVERSALREGRLMHYRAHRDIHSQLPPAAMSVSLNIMHVDPAQGWHDQYGFDLDSGTVTAVLNPTSTEVFLRCAVGMGGDAALYLADTFGRRHPSERMRLASYEARDSLASDPAVRDALWRQAERSGSVLLAHEAEGRRKRLETMQVGT